MSVTVQLTSAEIAALVNKYDDLKAAVLAKHLQENAPTLEITDVTSDAATEEATTSTAEDSDKTDSTDDAASTETASS